MLPQSMHTYRMPQPVTTENIRRENVIIQRKI